MATTTAPPATPPIQIVTTGGVASSYNIFGIKSGNLNDGPTPLVNGLTIHVLDNPNRDPADFARDPAILDDIATSLDHQVVGDANMA